MKQVTSVTEYFAALHPESRRMMRELRKAIRTAAPGAKEVISYGMPTFKQRRMLVFYGAFKDHCSLFPHSARVVEKFKKELTEYQTSRGTIQFPLNRPIPQSLVKRIVRARIAENAAREKKTKDVRQRNRRA